MSRASRVLWAWRAGQAGSYGLGEPGRPDPKGLVKPNPTGLVSQAGRTSRAGEPDPTGLVSRASGPNGSGEPGGRESKDGVTRKVHDRMA
ncbi:hypothetical protein GCM10009828_036870 [Actinoplanes couchii]|uniref:Uncharacterized protein n=1 Tax=Actinoplanes couchii TaxID=403638 RepID=A0ABQ3X9G8_9ACTN|nr:hypothetical protein Aco03nite_035550 [Actinoplanes couchii]